MNNLPKLLAVLVNYGDEQLEFLKKVVKELKSFKKFDVTIIVNSNIELNIIGIDEVNVFVLNDYQLLPLTCRKVIWENKDKFDLFVYGENDHLFLEKHIEKHIEYSNILPKNRISGLIQYEENGEGYHYPAYHASFDWDFNSVEEYNGKKFAHFSNIHQASFILTKKQLNLISKKINFEELYIDPENKLINKLIRKIKISLGFKTERLKIYSVKCKVNTDIYKYGGMKKMICISEFEDNLIHHLPNLYIEGKSGRNKLSSDSNRMKEALDKLM
ncbi:hypothetical protein [Flavobacterium pectinovorum]|uniref:Glycosyltransferase family 2 protein n=1 Tax=Flavobacterium pectinovorum TaxID=29533 RepID=A0A502ESS0_9FLAO|nr:hypothetical protein [Flavobacterium pectinovorum]TPG40112.1 hypothetical protein EAH81_12495 [Flavobacterium pectinovorum]